MMLTNLMGGFGFMMKNRISQIQSLFYINIPSAPSDGTSSILTFSSPGNILNTTGGDTQNKYMDGNWKEFHAFSFVGTSEQYRRIINFDSDVVIGSIGNHLFTRLGTNSTYFGIYGRYSDAPLYFFDVDALNPTSAVQISAYATGPDMIVQNIVNNCGGYAVFANTAGTLSGGNSTTPTTSSNNYGSLHISFVRSFNARSSTEHFYFGATTTNTYAIHSDLRMDNLLGYTSGWDAIQINNATNFILRNSTFVNGGTNNVGAQNASLQVQNAYGIVENNIFMGAPQGLRITTHNLVFRNNYVQWTGNVVNEILSYYGNYASTNRLMVDPITTQILIENCDFVSTTWTGALFRVLDPNVTITIRNCRISGPTSLFDDSRGVSPTGSLIDGGGNTFGATIPTPTFSNFDPTDFEGHGLLTEPTHHALGRGYRTLNPITYLSFEISKIYRTNQPITLTAIPSNATIINARWEIRDKQGVLKGIDLGLSASIEITEVGYYDVTFKCQTSTDQYERVWEDIFVWYPKFTEAEADIVINLANGNYFNNFNSADNSGLKIYVKGSGNAWIYPFALHGSAGYENYVRIQKEIGNIPITMNYSGATNIGLRLDGARYLMIDGYNDDGTRGWRLRGSNNYEFDVRQQDNGIFSTNVHIMGLDIEGDNSASGAAVRLEVPPASVSINASTHISEDNAVFDCRISKAGAEAIYLAYTNDQPQGGYTPAKMRRTVVAWNTIIESGNDGIQPCSNVDIRVHDNYIETWGVKTSQYHENAISWNHGNAGRCYNNFAINGKMGFNVTSGLYPYDIYAGQTTPGKLQVYNNIFIEGTPPVGGVSEEYFNYGQVTNGGTGNIAEWPVEIFNNTIICNKKMWGWGFTTGGWSIPNFKLFNNIMVKTGNAGEYPEMNWMYDGVYPTNATVNNLVREFSSYSDIGLNGEYKIPNLSSPAYTGASNTANLIIDTGYRDKEGLPLNNGGYAYGAFSGHDYKTITPTIDDSAAAIFTTAVSVGSITENGGTISFEANKVGLLYWVVVANDATAPTIPQIIAGNNASNSPALASGSIQDTGIASTGFITGLTQLTSYDLYAVFVTRNWVAQNFATKVDFTTIADVVAPTISNFVIQNANPDRIYFNSSEIISASTYGGFTISDYLGTAPTVTGVFINSGQITGHYFTLSSSLTAADFEIKLSYSGSGSNLQDVAGNSLIAFTATSITNNIEYDNRINVNIIHYNSNKVNLSSWNDVDFNGDVSVRTVIANLDDETNTPTGVGLVITDAFNNWVNNIAGGAGIYIPYSVANNQGIEVYSNSGAGSVGSLRLTGFTAGKEFDIIYSIKSNFGNGAGNISINGGSSVPYGTPYTEYKQSGIVDGNGNINIVMTQTVNNTSNSLLAFILILYP